MDITSVYISIMRHYSYQIKVFKLAGSYMTRLARDLTTCNCGENSYLVGYGRKAINQVNDLNINKFISRRKQFPSVQIVSDG